MNLTNGEYLLIVSGLLSCLTFVGLFSLKRHRESFIYQKLHLNKHKIYRLSRLCLTIFTFCLTLLSGSQFFQIVEYYSLASLIWSFLGITSLQILWWNLTYNHKKDSVSFISSSQSKKTKSAQRRGIKSIGVSSFAGAVAAHGAAHGANIETNDYQAEEDIIIKSLSQVSDKRPLQKDENPVDVQLDVNKKTFTFSIEGKQEIGEEELKQIEKLIKLLSKRSPNTVRLNFDEKG